MSGVEVVGILLGAFPLVISAIEHYDDMLEPTKAFLKFGFHLERLRSQLRTLYTSFQLTTNALLQPLVDEEKLDDMIENTNSLHWHDQSIVQSLKARLHRGYDDYIDMMNKVQNTVLELAMSIENIKGAENLDRDGLRAIIDRHPPALVGGKFQNFEFSKRLKFTMRRRRIVSLLKELQQNIKILEDLQRQTGKINKQKEKSAPDHQCAFVTPIENIRQRARSLYHALTKTWCSSHVSHSAGLLLEPRRRPIKRPNGRPNTRGLLPSQLDTGVLGLSLQKSSPKPEKWTEVEIQFLKPSDWVLLTDEQEQNLPLVERLNRFRPYPWDQAAVLEIVTNVCLSLQKTDDWTCNAFCIDDYGRLRGTYSVNRSSTFLEKELTLKTLLDSESRTLRLQEQYLLSITLVASMLQLNETPWFRKAWTNADIVFLRAETGFGTSNLPIDFKHPYIKRRQESSTNFAPRDTKISSDAEKFLALGILLVEICSGRSIDSLMTPQDCNSKSQTRNEAKFQAAMNWSKRQYELGDLFEGMFEAIMNCLGRFVDRDASLKNPFFFAFIESNVLAPLEQELFDMTK